MIKKRPKTAREVSAFSLFSMEEEQAWSDGALHFYLERAQLSQRDRSLATRLTYGVIQNTLLCDWYLKQFSKIRIQKIASRVKICLRLGIYQLILCDKIPAHAAVQESVSLIAQYAHVNARVLGFANGILRSVAKAVAENTLPRLDCPDKQSYYSLRYSHPEWLVRMLYDQYGQKQTADILSTNNEISPISVHIHTKQHTKEEICKILQKDGFFIKPHPIVDSILLIEQGQIIKHPLFLSGELTIQDAASAVCVDILAPQKGTFVLDCCAAPGGKSFYIAQKMENQGTLFSCDMYAHKLEKICQGAKRMGLSIVQPKLQNALETVSDWIGKADFVLCDVPCSGIGIIRKKPEIRYKNQKDIEKLPHVQRAILENCMQYVRPNGTLVYSTCTILKQENEMVVQDFLSRHPEFERVPIQHPVCGNQEDGMITLLPNIHQTDGFFIAKLRRKS